MPHDPGELTRALCYLGAASDGMGVPRWRRANVPVFNIPNKLLWWSAA